MLFKMKLVLCTLALTTANYARAQETTGKAGNQPATTQAGKAQPNDSQSPAAENQNQRRDRAAQSKDTQNRATDAQDRTTTTTENANQTGERRNETDRNRKQRDVNTQRTETRETRYSPSGDKPLDSHLASCLILGNKKEVTISQWAAERAKNEKVKEFARQMVKDHNQAIAMLQRFAGSDASKDLSSGAESTRINRSETSVNRSTTTTDSNRSSNENDRKDASSNPRNRDNESNRKSNDPNSSARNPDRDSSAKSSTDASNQVGADAATRTAANQANRDANDPSDRNRSVTSVQVRSEHEAIPDKMFAIQREVSDKCIAMAKQELEQSSNFDQAYVGMAISEHIGMIAKLETYKSYASEDLGKVIQESLDTAQGHLRHAKELVVQISHESPSAQRSETKRTEASSRSDATNRSDATSRDSNVRNPVNRDETGARRDATKKDAPKN